VTLCDDPYIFVPNADGTDVFERHMQPLEFLARVAFPVDHGELFAVVLPGIQCDGLDAVGDAI
jgi:hypothetical protein